MSRSRYMILALSLVLALGLTLPATPAGAQPDAPEPTQLLRFPDVHDDRVVFTYGGDLWVASTDGGMARRLTTHPGLELFARYSPDGRWIAFTGQYDGDEQVYVIPATGGVPRQLTYYPARGPLPPRWGYDHLVYGWTPDGANVLFRSLRDGWDIGDGRLFVAPVEGGLPTALPMPTAGAADFSPDGEQVVYSPLSRDFRSWKRYAGGWAQDLFLFDLSSRQATRITDHPRSDRDPMWIGEDVWFASDRTGTLNLFRYEPGSGQTTQVTESTVWDVRWPSAGPGGTGGEGQIVYELGGVLQLLDVATAESRPIPIVVPSDLVPTRPRRVEVPELLESLDLSPGGERALVVARGDVFTLPSEAGPTRNLTRSSDAHDKHARWSPDGRWIAYVSDATGEDQLYVVPQEGGEARQLTRDLRSFLYHPRWAPDGEHVALSNEDGQLFVVGVEDGTLVEVADDPTGQIADYVWSPDSQHLAFSMGEEDGFNSVWIWSAGDGQARRVTSDLFNEYNPAWDPGGDYLYFLADRAFAPQIGSFEWNYMVDRETYLYALALRRDVPQPFPPKSDEVELEDEDEDGDGEESEAADGDGEDGTATPAPLRIDFEGIEDRVARVPVEADNYSVLHALEDHLVYVRTAPFYYGRSPDREPAVMVFSLEDREAKELVAGVRLSPFSDGVGELAISADGGTLLVRKGRELTLYDLPDGGDGRKVPIGGMAMTVDPQQEWAQIFDEVWRRFRDFFYVENMHGYDWDGLRERYRPLLAHVAHRSDLNYLISEMIAELNVSHAYISGGDYEIPPRPPVGLPGARFELDPQADRYRIGEIFEGDNAEPKYRAPLSAIGVDVSPGLYVLAIDGQELTGGDNPYRLLRFKADHPVTLTVNERPTLDGAREVTYEPVTSEDDLIYLEMVETNRQRVAEMTGGRVGYLHLPDMGSNGIYEWIKWFYPQVRKDGLVIDVRGNGGGNVSQMLIERLSRDLLAVGFSRNSDVPSTYPATVFHGPMATLLNETSASDGDIFPAMFKEAGLGPLVGKRSWGGVIGITSRGPLIDGGSVNVPEFGFASPEGEWVVEGYGVDPDIVVENDPLSVLNDRDPQLERAVQEVLDRLEADPRTLPDRPPAPVKVE